ncbi:bacterial SH3 domain family [Clostridium botulinum C str. Eklund]|nr:bacterial SH3 domain family [Clostridium botulinum C str. Eklund]NEZ50264.1 amidase [Clostridium botulinum]
MKINKVYLKGQEKTGGWNNPNKIIIHHPEFYGTVQSLNDVMRNMGFSMIGYNYYVRKDGSVWQGRPVSATGANCYNQNHSSIGVCFEGNYDNDKTMPDAQFKSGVELIQYLNNIYGITEVNGHKYYRNTDCPGRHFPLQKMLDAVKGTPIKSSSSGSLDGRIGIVATRSSNLIVRDKPGTQGNKIGSLQKGSRVKLFKNCGNGWYEIYYGAHGGYVSADYINLI